MASCDGDSFYDDENGDERARTECSDLNPIWIDEVEEFLQPDFNLTACPGMIEQGHER